MYKWIIKDTIDKRASERSYSHESDQAGSEYSTMWPQVARYICFSLLVIVFLSDNGLAIFASGNAVVNKW